MATKKASWEDDYEMKAEYELKNGRPNPYAERMRHGSNLVLIDPELHAVFPSSAAVNEALRLIVKASAKAVKSKAAKQAKAR